MMWHFVYLSYESGPKGRNYIGKHTTSSLNDGYLGSYSDKSFFPDSRIILGVFKTAVAATQAEIQWQRVFNVVPDPGFANKSYQTSEKFDTTGLKMSADYRKKKSEQNRGEGNPNYGKTTPQAVKDKIANSLTGQTFSPERKERQSQALMGNSNKKGKPQPSSAIESARIKNTGRKNTPETIEKMRESARKRWANHRQEKSNDL